MAIDHLEGFCKYKKLLFDRKEKVSQGFTYDAINMWGPEDERQKQFTDISENLFENYNDRKEYALAQIHIIG
jgi:hypothetical protein